MTNKKNIALSARNDGGVIFETLRSIVVNVFDGNQKVKFRRKNWSSS